MRNWQIVALIIMMLLVSVPFAVSFREHPMNSGDTVAHIEATRTHVWQYPAQVLSEIPVMLDGNNPNKAFLWFDVSMLLIAMASLYFVFSRLVSRWAGVMAVVLAVFCSTGIASLFFAGAIFSFINVYILLPLGLYFLIMWIRHGKVYQGLLAIMFLVVCSVIHTTGLYVPALLFVFGTALILGKRYRKRGLIILGLVVVTLLAAVFTLGIPRIESFIGNPVASPVTVGEFARQYLGITTGVLLVAGLFMFFALKKTVQIKGNETLVVVALLSLAVVLLPLAFTSISRDPGRQAIDLVSVLALLGACLLGIVVKSNKYPVLSPALMIVAFLGAIPMIRIWMMGGTVTQ